MKCISLPFRLSDSYNFPASLTSKFRKTVHNGSFLKLYIPSTLKFDRKAEIPPLAPFTSVLHKEQSAATVCIRQHALAETEDSLGKINMADMGRRLSCLLQTLPVYLRLSNQVVLNRWHKKSDPKAALLNKYNNVFYPTKKVSTNEYNCSSVRLSVPTLSINAYSSFFPVITNLRSFPSTSHKR